MKAEWWLRRIGFMLILFPAITYAQEPRSVQLKKDYGEMDFAPQIVGVFSGELAEDLFCHPEGITTSIGIKIVSFQLFYCLGPDEGVRIAGNTIPDSICLQVRSHCEQSDVFINQIKAVDLDGSLRNLNPMRLWIVP
ncbi:MAG: hypothetical protein JJT77_06030, partial [Crocinitomicaceae bacterium]|nr:hypothetical protein [Crocinitomicaceae bacterium]